MLTGIDNWDSTFTLVHSNSGNWNEAYTTVQSNSGNWINNTTINSNIITLTASELFATLMINGSSFAIPLYKYN